MPRCDSEDFSTSDISAKVRPSPCVGMNTGSYPKPLTPRGAVAITPSTRPSKCLVAPSTRDNTMTQWKLAVRFVTPCSSARSRLRLDSSVASGPAKRAEYTPGRPPSASTLSPLSSATLQRPVQLLAECALRSAFSRKVAPLSMTSGHSGGSARTSKPSRSDCNSTSLPPLRLASTSRSCSFTIRACDAGGRRGSRSLPLPRQASQRADSGGTWRPLPFPGPR